MNPPEKDPVDNPLEESKETDLKAALKGDHPKESEWSLIAHNKKAIKGWECLSRDTPENVINAYDWLRTDAMKWKLGRCYPLRGKVYAGCWCYEIGSGDRLYYKPDEANKIARVYYVGAHPKDGIPIPPRDL